MRPLFGPTARQLNVLISLGFLALGYALYTRYLIIEQATVSLLCEAGADSWLCLWRRLALALFRSGAFGGVAMAVAVINLIRPSIVLLGCAMVAAAFGIVLYNIGGAGTAIGLLILSLARPAPRNEQDES
jgi:hypothetical protein